MGVGKTKKSGEKGGREIARVGCLIVTTIFAVNACGTDWMTLPAIGSDSLPIFVCLRLRGDSESFCAIFPLKKKSILQ